MIIYSSQYLQNYGTLKQCGDTLELTANNYYKQAGFDLENFVKKGEAGHEEKLDSSLIRTKSRIFELARCNEWRYFVTLTLDKSKYNRYDLPKFIKDLGQLIRDMRKKYGADIRYLLIPERHQDGAWHLHGFFVGIPETELREFSHTQKLPYKIRERLLEGKRVFTWSTYERKFGYASMEVLQNRDAASKYMTKYITKETLRTITELNAHCFYASKGLKGKEFIAEGFVNPFEADFVNEYCAKKYFRIEDKEDALKYIDTRKEQI